jgi:hypothetical protein
LFFGLSLGVQTRTRLPELLRQTGIRQTVLLHRKVRTPLETAQPRTRRRRRAEDGKVPNSICGRTLVWIFFRNNDYGLGVNESILIDFPSIVKRLFGFAVYIAVAPSHSPAVACVCGCLVAGFRRGG